MSAQVAKVDYVAGALKRLSNTAEEREIITKRSLAEGMAARGYHTKEMKAVAWACFGKASRGLGYTTQDKYNKVVEMAKRCAKAADNDPKNKVISQKEARKVRSQVAKAMIRAAAQV